MFQRKYTVKGEDVNDFMIMQNAAMLGYTTKLLDTFLFINGLTKEKLGKLNVGLEKRNDVIRTSKPLGFTQPFTLVFAYNDLVVNHKAIFVKMHFLNENQEVCAEVTRELFWFDYKNWTEVKMPDKLLKSFQLKQHFSRAC